METTVQREFGSGLLDVGYLDTRALRLPFEWDPNQLNNALYIGGSSCIPNTPASTPCPRPYSNFQTRCYTDPIGTSIYHSLQIKLEKH